MSSTLRIQSPSTASAATTYSEPLLNTAQAAAVLGFHASYLAKARLSGTGPKYLKIGGRSVRYRRADIEAWLANKTRTSTSDAE
jgi:predicted DNA-binding transcriptional regulator AlpA